MKESGVLGEFGGSFVITYGSTPAYSVNCCRMKKNEIIDKKIPGNSGGFFLMKSTIKFKYVRITNIVVLHCHVSQMKFMRPCTPFSRYPFSNSSPVFSSFLELVVVIFFF